MTFDYVKEILNSPVYEVAKETLLEEATLLSQRLNNQILLKREDQQPIFSFKIRGAYNRMSKLNADERDRGVIAASAGNHAQGVALSAQVLGVDATVVMPETTPEIKQAAVKALGATVVLHGTDYSAAGAYAKALCDQEGKLFIPPFDDQHVIAGQGTIAAELVRQHSGPLDAVFVPVGGGGLIAGIAAFFKEIRPEVKIIGVEPYGSDAMYQSIKAGQRVTLDEVGIFADGVAVKQVGALPYTVCAGLVDQVVRVSTDEICAAIKDIFEDTRSIVEPAGALGVAGVKRYVADQGAKGECYVAINSGANINFHRLRHVSERSEIGEGREAILAVTIPEERGAFLNFCEIVGRTAITEFNYRYADNKEARIFVGFQCKDEEQSHRCLEKLIAEGYKAVDLTNDEISKVHGRYLVGGRVPELQHEKLYSFRFPEYPGALLNFLKQISGRWNISLFHYRNHGADFGRVLCGLQVPPETDTEFQQFLQDLGYRAREKTGNPFYELFLK